MTDLRRSIRLPAHVAVYAGLCAGAYAIALAGVTALESATETAQIAERAPLLAGIAEISSGHDSLAERLTRTKTAYEAAAAGYAAAASPLADLDASLASLAAKVGAIDGASRSLPTSIRLPTIASTVRTSSVPAVQATTGASGVVK